MKSIEVLFMPHPPLAIPDIGGGKERRIAETLEGYRMLALKVKRSRPKTIIYITPHGNSFTNGLAMLYEPHVVGNLAMFGHDDIFYEKDVDIELTDTIHDTWEASGFLSVRLDHESASYYKVQAYLDHGVLVPMHFIDEVYDDYKIVHITTSHQDAFTHYQLGVLLKRVIEHSDEKIMVVCSGDLSHALMEKGPYAYHPFGPIFDERVKEAIVLKDPAIIMNLSGDEESSAAQCGLRSFVMGFGLMDGHDYQSQILSYEGPFGVGYLTGYLENDFTTIRESLLEHMIEERLDEFHKQCELEDDYVTLARKTIETYVKTNRKLILDLCPEWMEEENFHLMKRERAGAFVSIHKHGALRGCIGTTEPTADNLIEEIMYSAISACSSDPRFNRVREDELDSLEIKVDRLYPYEPVFHLDELDVKRYGVIVEQGAKRGLLLPNLDGVDSVEEQLTIAKRKAGITDGDFNMYRFEVERHG